VDYFIITKRRKLKPKEHYQLPDAVWQKIAILFFASLTLSGMAMFEKLFIGRVLIVWFIPILVLIIYLNFKIFRR
jgi:hypothetical protein